MNGAIAPFSTHVQHENAKYRNAASNVGAWPVLRNFLKEVMAGFFLGRWESNGTADTASACCDDGRGEGDLEHAEQVRATVTE
jgi:hypothetical protein